MWATATRLPRRYWLELAWAAFAAVNIAAIFWVTQYETIPFHLVWVSLALLYCVRSWSVAMTATVLGVVMLVSAVALSTVVLDHGAGYDELSEVPLMAAMYVVIVWHARRSQHAMEERRRAAERERNFIRDASHTLRTPITVALGHAELARTVGNGHAPDVSEDIDIVVDELRRISTISDRLLLLASAGHPNFLDRSTVEVGDLLRICAKRWRATAPREWSVDVPVEGTIVGDEERLALALDCLVENAVKATGEGDRISIACRADGETVCLEVADSGVGISEEEQRRVFERFSRVGRSEGKTNGGTGLGLAIAKAVVEAHGGTLELESEPGRGSSFHIRLNGFNRAAPDVFASIRRAPTFEAGEPDALVLHGSGGTAP
jgi:signal transduction histidine kinase